MGPCSRQPNRQASIDGNLAPPDLALDVACAAEARSDRNEARAQTGERELEREESRAASQDDVHGIPRRR